MTVSARIGPTQGITERVDWHGVDVFRFDAAGQITGKYTYASYDRPKLSRDLGVRL